MKFVHATYPIFGQLLVVYDLVSYGCTFLIWALLLSNAIMSVYLDTHPAHHIVTTPACIYYSSTHSLLGARYGAIKPCLNILGCRICIEHNSLILCTHRTPATLVFLCLLQISYYFDCPRGRIRLIEEMCKVVAAYSGGFPPSAWHQRVNWEILINRHITVSSVNQTLWDFLTHVVARAPRIIGPYAIPPKFLDAKWWECFT